MSKNDLQENKQKTTTTATTRITKLSSVALTSAIVAAVLIGGFAVIPSYGQASSATQRLSVPFEFSINLCGGEEVQVSGTANIVIHTTESPEGEFRINTFHLNYQGAKAVSLTSGNTGPLTYAETDLNQVSRNTFVADTEAHLTLATQGDEINTIFHILFHMTFENGEPKATVSHTDIKCQG
jgi:hypothetical protein